MLNKTSPCCLVQNEVSHVITHKDVNFMHKQQVCAAEIRRAECFKKHCPLESAAGLDIEAVVEQEGCDIHLTEPNSMMKRDEIVR